MDHYADDHADLTQHLDLHGAVHAGHSVGGGEVARYIGRHGESRVAKVALFSAVTASEGVIANWWRRGLMGGAKGQYDCVARRSRRGALAELMGEVAGQPTLIPAMLDVLADAPFDRLAQAYSWTVRTGATAAERVPH